MQHLYSAWADFSADIASAAHSLILADYDGTLTPIVGRPQDAVLAPEVREELASLGRKAKVSVGIISGRSLTDLKAHVGIGDIYYAGNHGLEIEGPGLSYINPQALAARTVIRDLAESVTAELGGIAGVVIEAKGLGLSVHYRLVSEAETDAVTGVFLRLTAPLVDAGAVRVTTGKKVLEVRPPVDWGKGSAVTTIAREIGDLFRTEKMTVVFLGDDLTDEDAFRVLARPAGWSVFVGGENSTSSAEYYLNSPAEVAEFLARLNKLT